MADFFSSVFSTGSGGKLRYQEFTSVGTFTPSAALLAKGGQVYFKAYGGGGGGGGGGGTSGGGGGAGEW